MRAQRQPEPCSRLRSAIVVDETLQLPVLHHVDDQAVLLRHSPCPSIIWIQKFSPNSSVGPWTHARSAGTTRCDAWTSFDFDPLPVVDRLMCQYSSGPGV